MVIPEKVRIKANPSIYLPLGSPGDLANLDFDFGKMADVSLSATGGDTVVYDYPGEFPETRAFLTWTELIGYSFTAPSIPSPLPPSMLTISIPVVVPPAGSADGIDLSDLQSILAAYPGLEFKSVPAYIYINGPAKLLKEGKLSLSLEINGGTPEIFALTPMPLPDLPPSGSPMTRPLSPKPAAKIDLTGILNNPANTTLDFDYSISVGQSLITIPAAEFPAFLEELKTPLTVCLAIILPLQFTAPTPVPILAADEASRGADNCAIVMNDSGTDLFGRNGGGEASETMEKVLNNMTALSLQVSVTNNLGINGFLTMNGQVTPESNRPNNPLEPIPPPPAGDTLGRISLTGDSTITLTKEYIEKTNPFNPAFELFLEGDFEIKRTASNPGLKPLEMSLGAVVQTNIDKVF
jgi:hypothetical protein